MSASSTVIPSETKCLESAAVSSAEVVRRGISTTRKTSRLAGGGGSGVETGIGDVSVGSAEGVESGSRGVTGDLAGVGSCSGGVGDDSAGRGSGPVV